jgi:hypothetical protein
LTDTIEPAGLQLNDVRQTLTGWLLINLQLADGRCERGPAAYRCS